MIKSMMNNKYESQLDEKCAILDKKYIFLILFSKHNQKPKADSNSCSAVQKPNILATELRRFTTKSNDINYLTKHLNPHFVT